MPKPVIEDTDSIFERLKKIKEEEVEAQKPNGTCSECQKLKRVCDGSCYVFCKKMIIFESEYELDYSCEGPISNYGFQDSI